MGLPDNYSLVPYRGGMMKDGPRYKMIGNGFPVPLINWIGKRIDMVESIL
jgi:DNA (cytosine-5)-methyltransferase 1